MNQHLLHTINSFAGLRVLVVGEAILDSYLAGESDRLCREAPVPIVAVAERTNSPGGAANTAVNARSLGAQVTFLSVIGDDGEGQLLCQALRECGVSVDQVLVDPMRQTLAKHRIIAASQILLRYDQGTTAPVAGAVEATLMARFAELYARHDVIIISDYNYGILTPAMIQVIAEQQARTPRLLAVDARDLGTYRHVGVTAVKPNYGEAIRLLELEPCDTEIGRLEQMTAREADILKICGAQIAAVTLDKLGALVFECGRPLHRTYAQPRPHSRATGAGDTFICALALALAAGAYTPTAAELASAAAAVVVDKDGTNACTIDELRAYFAGAEKFVTDWSSLADQLAFYRQKGRRIVFTNGCFDILHRGHISYLNQAKALGDILIVGLNADESVRRLKGPKRPINSLDDRARVLAALSCVDHIVPFTQDTPRELIRLVRPDLFVKGGDYTHETLPEAPLVKALGGEVQILPYLEDFSTSTIIERIRQAYAWNGNGVQTLETVGEG